MTGSVVAARGGAARFVRRVLVAMLVVAAAGSLHAASAAASCPPMEVFGVRGSGETSTNHGGYGWTVKDVIDGITAEVPGADVHAINYQAIGVDWWDPAYYGSLYRQSVYDGEIKLSAAIGRFLNGPCRASTYLYLVGYSQGAQVVGDVYQRVLDDPERQRVKGVVLIGDPRFRGPQGAPVNTGSYDRGKNGVYLLSHRTVSGSQTGIVRSYCAGGDPVCGFDPRAAIRCVTPLLKATCPHTHYPLEAFPGSTLTYTRHAAQFLVHQWRLYGPKTVRVGPRRSILVFGSGDYSEDPAATDELATALRGAGYSVTVTSTLPTDLSRYGQVWWYGIDDLHAQQQQLIDYARSGGSLYLSGEWNGCCSGYPNDQLVTTVFDSLVLTVGGMQLGPDNFGGIQQLFTGVNPDVIDNVATVPNTLTTFTGSAVGAIEPFNIGSDNFVFRDPNNNGIVGVWDEHDVRGGGRLAVVMDINWIQGPYGDPHSPLVSNLAYFLSHGAP